MWSALRCATISSIWIMLTDSNAETLRQLTRIADAVSAQHTSPWWEWLKTIASFVAGLLTAYLSDMIRSRSSERSDQSRMRRIVYSELAQCFLMLHSWVGDEKTLKGQRYTVFKNLCDFDGEAYIRQNPAIFYGLPEGQVLTQMYYWFHRVDGGGLENPRTYGLAEMRAPLRFFSDRYRNYRILRKNFKKVLADNDYRLINNAVREYEKLATLEEMVDSGLITVVEGPKRN